MQQLFNLDIKESIRKLHHHPIYGSLHDLKDLRRFMECHVFSVWDFMSLVKYLQHQIVPAQIPWVPRGSGTVRRFINSLVLEEESDENLSDKTGKATYSSHFELYCQAMLEVGADPQFILRFAEIAAHRGITAALNSDLAPDPSHFFTQATFDFIASDKPHIVAAVLATGREHIIPPMFRNFLEKMVITPEDAPVFHYYLRRHIHLDENFHAPLSLQLVHELCEGEERKIKEAQEAAKQAVWVRLLFWDKVLHFIKNGSSK